MEFRKNLKELSEEIQKIITDAVKRHVVKTRKGKVFWVSQQFVTTSRNEVS